MATVTKPKLHRFHRRSFNKQAQDEMASNGGNTTETTPLISRETSRVESLTRDDRSWIRYPALFLWKTWEVLKSSYANVLLAFVPLGIVAGVMGWDPVTVFTLNFFAIIPLAALLSFATEELSASLGETIGGLMNATFGNAVELIVSIIALRNHQIRIVQASMLGSILSNILLVLGSCFIAGGIAAPDQEFNVTVAQAMGSLMAVAAASLVMPATLYAVISSPSSDISKEKAEEDVLLLSRATSIILLFLYILYLYFQLKSHAKLFEGDSEQQQQDSSENGTANANGNATGNSSGDAEEGGRKDGDTLKPIPAMVALVLITILVAVCADYLVDSIDALVERVHVSRTFIGLILLPIVGNAAEHVTAVLVSYKSKMDLAIAVAIGSSMQIAIFITPFLVILGWIIGEPMSLHFQLFETIVFFLSVLVVNYLIQDGKSNYLEGFMCIGTYLIIAVAFGIYPDNAGTGDADLWGPWRL